jgi:hypothetical protein
MCSKRRTTSQVNYVWEWNGSGFPKEKLFLPPWSMNWVSVSSYDSKTVYSNSFYLKNRVIAPSSRIQNGFQSMWSKSSILCWHLLSWFYKSASAVIFIDFNLCLSKRVESNGGLGVSPTTAATMGAPPPHTHTPTHPPKGLKVKEGKNIFRGLKIECR